ncbi:MAG TPA: alpha/beta fold hydrolase, partial [Thermoanaerobaculia bacterium]
MKRALALVLLSAACATAPPPQQVDGEQGRLFVSDGGSGAGTPIVFIHGNGANLTQWSAQLPHFRRSRRAIAYDLRGMGRSDVPVSGEYTIDGMVEDLHRLVNALNVDTFVLVGHSYGGAVAAAYAARYPERVAGVVFADAAGDIKATREQSERFLEALRMDKHATVRKAYEPMIATATEDVKTAILTSVDRTSTEAYVEAMEGMRDFSVARAVASIRAPML